MDLQSTLREFYAERERISRAIASLEEFEKSLATQTVAPPGRRRGRKSMNQEERLEVSKRMRNYWEQRRQLARASI